MTIWTPPLSGQGPLYRQLADAIAQAIESGELTAEQRLPTHRALAEQLGVTVGTITRAYALAEQQGWLQARVITSYSIHYTKLYESTGLLSP